MSMRKFIRAISILLAAILCISGSAFAATDITSTSADTQKIKQIAGFFELFSGISITQMDTGEKDLYKFSNAAVRRDALKYITYDATDTWPVVPSTEQIWSNYLFGTNTDNLQGLSGGDWGDSYPSLENIHFLQKNKSKFYIDADVFWIDSENLTSKKVGQIRLVLKKDLSAYFGYLVVSFQVLKTADLNDDWETDDDLQQSPVADVEANTQLSAETMVEQNKLRNSVWAVLDGDEVIAYYCYFDTENPKGRRIDAYTGKTGTFVYTKEGNKVKFRYLETNAASYGTTTVINATTMQNTWAKGTTNILKWVLSGQGSNYTCYGSDEIQTMAAMYLRKAGYTVISTSAKNLVSGIVVVTVSTDKGTVTMNIDRVTGRGFTKSGQLVDLT